MGTTSVGVWTKYSTTALLADLASDDIDPLNWEIRCDGSIKKFEKIKRSDF